MIYEQLVFIVQEQSIYIDIIVPQTQVFNYPKRENNARNLFVSAIILILKNI
jgi:hypothetical protein